MRKIILGLLVLVLAGCDLLDEKKETDLDKKELRHKVRVVIQKQFKKYDLLENSLTYVQKWIFNEAGNLIESNKDLNLTEMSKYKYDKDGNLTKKSGYDKNGELKWKAKLKYEKWK